MKWQYFSISQSEAPQIFLCFTFSNLHRGRIRKLCCKWTVRLQLFELTLAALLQSKGLQHSGTSFHRTRTFSITNTTFFYLSLSANLWLNHLYRSYLCRTDDKASKVLYSAERMHMFPSLHAVHHKSPWTVQLPTARPHTVPFRYSRTVL